MNKLILSGGPHTGKTTLINALKEKYSSQTDIEFIIEPATEVIHSEKQKEKGILPWENYNAFSELVIAKSLELENAILPSTKAAILDRSLIDTVAYARLNKCDHILPELFKLIGIANYSIILFCDFVGDYNNTHIRFESYDDARRAHDALRIAYDEQTKIHGYRLIDLPGVSLVQRVAIVTEVLANFIEIVQY